MPPLSRVNEVLVVVGLEVSLFSRDDGVQYRFCYVLRLIDRDAYFADIICRGVWDYAGACGSGRDGVEGYGVFERVYAECAQKAEKLQRTSQRRCLALYGKWAYRSLPSRIHRHLILSHIARTTRRHHHTTSFALLPEPTQRDFDHVHSAHEVHI